MTIQHVRCSDYVQITADEFAVQDRWNSFESIEEAIKYMEKHLHKKPGVVYGFVVVKKDLWKYIP